MRTSTLLRAATVVTALSCAGVAHAQFTIFEANGALASDIQSSVDGLRAALGGLNTTPGVFPGGRREINWDAVPDTFADPNLFPGNFFAQTSGLAGRQRGANFTTPGAGFLVSADSSNPKSTSSHFGFSGDFQTFSPERLFAPVGSNITDVTFFVPGTNIPALVSGFGAVFTDAEVVGLTKIEFFDSLDALIFSRDVLAGANNSLSFLGASAASPMIARVRITSGDLTLVANNSFSGSGTDAVVMDDFLYGEPQQIGSAAPEPATAGLLLLGLGALARRRRK